MKNYYLIVFISLLLCSCAEQGINVSLKNIIKNNISKTGTIEASFGEKGSISLKYDNFLEKISGNFRVHNKICSSDESCIYYLISQSRGVELLIKLNKDGSLDLNFGEKGRLFLDEAFNELFSPTWRLIGVDSQNRIYLNTVPKIIRLLSNGQRDQSFGDKGILTLNNSTYNFILTSILYESNDELIFYGGLRPGGNDISYGAFGTSLLAIDKSGNIKNSSLLNNQSFLLHEPYASYDKLSSFSNEPLVESEGGELIYYSIGATPGGGSLRVKKLNFQNQSVAGFNYNGGINYPINNKLLIKKYFIVNDYIYIFLSSLIRNSTNAEASRLVVVNKITGVVDAAKSRNFLRAPSYYLIDDVFEGDDGFILNVRYCATVNNGCMESMQSVLKINFDGQDSIGPVLISNQTFSNNANIGSNGSLLSKHDDSLLHLNFSTLYQYDGYSGSGINIKKIDQNLEIDNSYSETGQKNVELGYDFPINLLSVDDDVALDDKMNTYYLVSYQHSDKQFNKIAKLNKEIKAVTSFGVNGVINLESEIEVNKIQLDEVNQHLYLLYVSYPHNGAEIRLRRYKMTTGEVDIHFGINGSLLLKKTAMNRPSASGTPLYHSQLLRQSKGFKIFSKLVQNKLFVFFKEDQKISAVKVNLSTSDIILNDLEISDIGLTNDHEFNFIEHVFYQKNTQQIILYYLVRNTSTSERFLALTSFDFQSFSLVTSEESNGTILLPNILYEVNGFEEKATEREVLKLTNNYIYLLEQNDEIKMTSDGSSYERFKTIRTYSRYSYNGQRDLIFDRKLEDLVSDLDKSNSMLNQDFRYVVLAGNFASDFLFNIDIISRNASSAEDLFELAENLNPNSLIMSAKLFLSENGTIENLLTKKETFIEYSNSLSDNNILTNLDEKYSFEKGSYIYKIYQDGFDQKKYPKYRLYKINN